MLRKFPATHRCTSQCVEALYGMAHGGGCSTAVSQVLPAAAALGVCRLVLWPSCHALCARVELSLSRRPTLNGAAGQDLCMYNSLLLLSREQFFSFPPAALAGIPVSDAAKVTPELCGCGPPDGAAAPPVDFGSVAQMLSTLPKGLGGRHPNGLPWYTVDGHTRRGSGMDTTGLFHSAAQRWGLAGEIEDWPAAEVLVSRTPNRSCLEHSHPRHRTGSLDQCGRCSVEKKASLLTQAWTKS